MSAAVHNEPRPGFDRNGRSAARATAEDFAAMAEEYRQGEAERAKLDPPVRYVDPDSFDAQTTPERGV